MKRKSITLLMLLLAFALVVQTTTAFAGAIRSGFNGNTLPRNDDGSTGSVAIGFPIDFFGANFTNLYVNNNGNVTFDSSLSTYTPFNIITAGRQIIAPFFGDVDTNSGGSPVTYGSGTVNGRPAFGVNWVNVNCYYSGSHTVLNSFQLVMIERGDTGTNNFDFEFNYDQILWQAGTASGGDNSCLGGSPARVGFSNGSTTSFELPGSGVNNAFLDSGPASTSLIHNSLNSTVPGRYVFAARNGNIQVEFNYAMDILPGTCTNEVAIDSPGTMTVTIIGTNNDSDVNLINVSSLALEGVAPISSSIADISSPIAVDGNGNPLPGDANCSGGNAADGKDDLVLIFPIPAIASAIGPVNNGDLVGLSLTGSLNDSTALLLNDSITVLSDTTAPVVTAPADVTAEATGPQTAVAIGTATATDNVGVVSISSNAPANYTASTTTVVTWTACDAAGNCGTATQNVTIVDTTAPVVTAPADVTTEATGPQTAVAIGSATATDAVGVVSISSNQPADYTANTTTVVTWTACDAAGNCGTATQNVSIVDTTAPVVTAPADVTVEATGPQTAVAIGTATATDAVGVVSISSDAPADYTASTTTVVTWTACDAAGNCGTATQNVTVQDTTAPVITAPADITTAATGPLTPVSTGTATATDAVGVASITSDQPAGFPVDATTVVTWTACDAAGNCSSATQNVTIEPFVLDLTVKKAKLKLHHNGDTDKDKDNDRGPKDWMQVSGTFSEFANGDGLNFTSETVIITIDGLSWTLPAGSFVAEVEDGKTEWEYKGPKSGLNEVEFDSNGKFKIKVKRMDLSAIPFGVAQPLTIRIGNDLGETTVTFNTGRGKDDDDKGKDKDKDKGKSKKAPEPAKKGKK